MHDAMWALVAAERLSLADLLDDLTPDQWETPSLCTQWRVRDVAAHLAMTPAGAPGVGEMARALLRTRGHLWAAGCDVAVAYAHRPTARLVDELRSSAGSRTKPVFVTSENILLDLVVHGQDIAIPLGRDRVVPPAAGEVALHRSWTMGWPFHAQRQLSGVRLRSEDCEWSGGSGPEVYGGAADLLLLMTARTTTALDRLHGPGIEMLRQRTMAATSASRHR